MPEVAIHKSPEVEKLVTDWVEANELAEQLHLEQMEIESKRHTNNKVRNALPEELYDRLTMILGENPQLPFFMITSQGLAELGRTSSTTRKFDIRIHECSDVRPEYAIDVETNSDRPITMDAVGTNKGEDDE